MNCFGEETTGYRTGRELSEHTYTDVDGVFKERGIITFFTRDRLSEILENLNYRIVYYEDLLENRNGLVTQLLVTSFCK